MCTVYTGSCYGQLPPHNQVLAYMQSKINQATGYRAFVANACDDISFVMLNFLDWNFRTAHINATNRRVMLDYSKLKYHKQNMLMDRKHNLITSSFTECLCFCDSILCRSSDCADWSCKQNVLIFLMAGVEDLIYTIHIIWHVDHVISQSTVEFGQNFRGHLIQCNK